MFLSLWYKYGRLSVLLQQLYARLSELIGLNDHLLLLDFFVRKIATNLKCYTQVIFCCWSSLLILFSCAWNFLFRHLKNFLIAVWGSYWPNLESFLGAGIWVCCFFSIVENLYYLLFFCVSIKYINVIFLLQLYDWKATTQVGNSQVHSTQSHCKTSLIGFLSVSLIYLVATFFCFTFWFYSLFFDVSFGFLNAEGAFPISWSV